MATAGQELSCLTLSFIRTVNGKQKALWRAWALPLMPRQVWAMGGYMGVPRCSSIQPDKELCQLGLSPPPQQRKLRSGRKGLRDNPQMLWQTNSLIWFEAHGRAQGRGDNPTVVALAPSVT